MLILDAVSCADTFPGDGQQGGAQLFPVYNSSGGYFAVAANPVYIQTAYTIGRDRAGGVFWTPPQPVPVGNGVLPPGVVGIRFRNYTAGSVALVSGALAEPTEPAIQITAGGVAVPVGPVTATTYRKTTPKAVNTTVAATDLLNGEINVAAGVLGTSGVARLSAWGDFLNNSGGNAAPPRLQLVLGGTTLLDTGAAGGGLLVASATRYGWECDCEIMNLGSPAAQLANFLFVLASVQGASNGANFTTGEGTYTVLNPAGTVLGVTIGKGVQPSAAVNTVLAQPLVLNVINGSASAGYETKLLGALVEVI